RFFAGGMDEQETGHIAGLYRLDPDLTVTQVDGGIVCSNMPCWSPDDRTFYFAETWEAIYAYDYDIATGSLSNKRVLVDLRDEPGGADGSTIDEEGYIWNAQVISGRLIRYAPDGTIDREIPFPVRNLTSCTFGGDRLDVLYVTSLARVVHPPHGRFVKEAAPQPHAGGVFAVRGLGVRGLPEPRFVG
ncbi:MAG: SMP-30/gluconolactonase/LRE family protein, partial [Alphaproteobacteria bacterium]|nr:SMP-30/gluconolactonase/LRE family protein [Alphaproteobacteria bacterium]